MEANTMERKAGIQHQEHSESHDDTKINEKIEVIQVEAATQQLNVIDFDLLSRESIQFKSRATLRLLLVIIIQGISELQVFSFALPVFHIIVSDSDLYRFISVRNRLRRHLRCSCASSIQDLFWHPGVRKWLQVGYHRSRNLHW
jgi:hypothetical protein